MNPSLQEKDFEKCAKKGECCQCGLCCIAFAVDVPSVPGQANSPVKRKETGESCPQMSFDARGRMICLLHNAKDDIPGLEHCRKWNGNVAMGDGRTYFDALRFTTLMEMLFPTSAEDVLLITEAWRTGRIPPSLIVQAEEFLCEHPDAIIKLCNLYIQRKPQPFPVALFDTLDLEGAILLLRDQLRNYACELERQHTYSDSEESRYYRTHLRSYFASFIEKNS